MNGLGMGCPLETVENPGREFPKLCVTAYIH